MVERRWAMTNGVPPPPRAPRPSRMPASLSDPTPPPPPARLLPRLGRADGRQRLARRPLAATGGPNRAGVQAAGRGDGGLVPPPPPGPGPKAPSLEGVSPRHAGERPPHAILGVLGNEP